MTFNQHFNLRDKHAFLGASKYHWINYDEKKLASSYAGFMAMQRGTELHDLACKLIKLNQRLPRSRKTLNMYVNDAIGFKMMPEQILYYSDNCFGTADAISFRDKVLRIHDLKTGSTPAHMEQLLIYASLLCLEYHEKPEDISMELRIYQGNEILACNPSSEEITPIMAKIISFDKIINRIKSQEG